MDNSELKRIEKEEIKKQEELKRKQEELKRKQKELKRLEEIRKQEDEEKIKQEKEELKRLEKEELKEEEIRKQEEKIKQEEEIRKQEEKIKQEEELFDYISIDKEEKLKQEEEIRKQEEKRKQEEELNKYRKQEELKNIVDKLKEDINNNDVKNISEIPNLREQVIKTRGQKISSQTWSPMFEKKLKIIFNIGPKKDKISGDGQYNESKETVEIKVSLGSKNCLNFVQIRPHHKCDKYLLMAYNIYEGELGRVYLFEISHNKIVDLILNYGNYAHGTIKKQGKITLENINKNMYEYALRINLLNEKGKKIWNELLKYEITFNYENIN